MSATKEQPMGPTPLDVICMHTQMTLVRNVDGLPFPGQLTDRRGREAAQQLVDRLQAIVPLEDLTDDKALAAGGNVRYGLAPEEDRSPHYRLLRITLQHGTVIWCEVMSANHYTFSLCGSFTDFRRKAEILTAFVDALARPLHFAFDPEFGYLSAQLTLTGTGLRIRSWMHLPGLAHFGHLRELCNAAEADGVLAEPDQPEFAPPGHLVILFNRCSLGKPVAALVEDYAAFLLETVRQESLARIRLHRDEPFVLMDLLTRTQAILKSAYMISEDDALDALSDLRMAVSLGVIDAPGGFDALADNWFDFPHRAIFFREFGKRILANNKGALPPEVVQFKPWRDDALRAICMQPLSKFHISQELKDRANRQ